MSSDRKPMLMSLPDFAAHVSISLSTLRRRVEEGVVPVLHEGRRVSVPVAIAEKRYMAYLIEREREYRKARAATGKAASPAESTFADKAVDIAARVGLSIDVLGEAAGSNECVSEVARDDEEDHLPGDGRSTWGGRP